MDNDTPFGMPWWLFILLGILCPPFFAGWCFYKAIKHLL